MRPRSKETGLRRDRRDWTQNLACLIAAICVLTAAGCEEETRNLGKRPETRALDQTGVNVSIDVENPSTQPQPQPQAPARKPGPILGQRTTAVRDASKELKQPGAKVASSKITAKDPITVVGNAYVSIIGRTSVLKIQQAVDLYHATNDRYPKDLDEFMTEIIKANNIALPVLPPYQAYAYDDKEHKLIVLEYEDRKN
jgi:hypothetical protein